MVAQNEVRFRVRSNALDLVEFSVEKMQRITGLHISSIRTELTRMKREGYLTSKPVPGTRKGPGAPPHRYRLTEDEEKLDELARSVEIFYRPPALAHPQPTSIYYEAVRTLLDQLEQGQISVTEREATLDKAKQYLEMAAADEGIKSRRDEKTEVVAAYVALLRARLAMIQGHWSEAEAQLTETHAIFSNYQLNDGLEYADALANALVLEQVMATSVDFTPLLQKWHAILQDRHGHIPISSVRRFLERLQTLVAESGPEGAITEPTPESRGGILRRMFRLSPSISRGAQGAGELAEFSSIEAETISTSEAGRVWLAALSELQLQMTKATFDTWVKQTHVVAYEDGTFIIGVQNGYAKDWLENRLMGTVKRTLAGILNRSVEVRFAVHTPAVLREGPTATLRPKLTPLPPFTPQVSGGQSKFGLNPHYTFDQFIVGSSNRLAHAASLAVVENPATAYNPLFLYGDVGLGKTHLLQAIAHYAIERNLQVLYVSSETFTNDLINAIRSKATESFRELYSSTDFLLVDDIQFVAGKESTQEEFFRIFNTLHSSGRQIVISSDRPPQSIPTLEERLASRFEWGLIADIQPPDLEMRRAILRFKAEYRGARVPNEVMEFIARQMQNNIRELEGGFNRVLAHAALMRVPVSLDLARQALSDLVAKQEKLTLPDIIRAVALHYGVSEADLVGQSRRKEIAWPRQVAMYLAREDTNASLSEIGQALGGRDHTVVLYGSEKIADQIERDDALRRAVIAIRESLYSEVKTIRRNI
jgi:chromosomal replication initiator protein